MDAVACTIKYIKVGASWVFHFFMSLAITQHIARVLISRQTQAVTQLVLHTPMIVDHTRIIKILLIYFNVERVMFF